MRFILFISSLFFCQILLGQTNSINSYDFTSTVALNGCSGMIVKFDNSKKTEPALLLSAGHCLSEFFPEFMPLGHVMYQEDIFRHAFSVMNARGSVIRRVYSEKMLYATYTGTDIAIFQLTESIDTLEKAGVPVKILARKKAPVNTPVHIVSGYWREGYSCVIEKNIYAIREVDRTNFESMRLSKPGCTVVEGTSGSPIINVQSGEVVGVSTTINEGGEQCTLDNPCEVDEHGVETVKQGHGYGQQVYWLYTCRENNGSFNLYQAGCRLPKPNI